MSDRLGPANPRWLLPIGWIFGDRFIRHLKISFYSIFTYKVNAICFNYIRFVFFFLFGMKKKKKEKGLNLRFDNLPQEFNNWNDMSNIPPPFLSRCLFSIFFIAHLFHLSHGDVGSATHYGPPYLRKLINPQKFHSHFFKIFNFKFQSMKS